MISTHYLINNKIELRVWRIFVISKIYPAAGQKSSSKMFYSNNNYNN